MNKCFTDASIGIILLLIDICLYEILLKNLVMKNRYLTNTLFLLGLLVVFGVSIYLFRAPEPLPADAESEQFSAYRAFEHTKQIAQKPHSLGTDEHERVKNYIVNELTRIPIRTTLQTTTSIYTKRGLIAGYVTNILGTLKGTESKKCVLIVGHYDSQPHTLGAADDGSAVASMLEAARALKEIGTFKNDIVFLFTDGEEADLFGAKAFVDENGLKDSVGVILNIEARGSSGPSITYEVSPENGWIMREYAKAVPYPFAHSIAYEIYKLLPNDSDFTPFREAGLSGFNIAFIDDFSNYHSMTDNPVNLSLGSLQHNGSYIMAIAKHFGNLDLSNTKAKDMSYFNWAGSSLILYPIRFNLFFVILITGLFAFAIYLGVKKRRVSIGKILLAFLIFIFSMTLVLLFTWLLQKAILALYPYYSIFYSANFYNIKDYFFAFTCLAIAVFSATYMLLIKRISAENFLFGSLFFNYIVMFLLLYFIPSGAYLSIVPLIFILIGLVICIVFNLNTEENEWKYFLVHFLSLIPVITLLTPLVKMLYVTFGLNTIFGGVAVVVLLLGYLIIPMKIIYDRKKWLLPIVAVSFMVFKLLSAHFSSGFDKDQPLQSNVSYFLDSDKNKAVWFSPHQFMDDWKQQFFIKPETSSLTTLYPNSDYKFLQNKADVYDIPAPVVLVNNDSLKNGIRRISLTFESMRKAQYCRVLISKNANLSNIIINGKKIFDKNFYSKPQNNFYTLTYFGLSKKTLELQLDCQSTGKFEVILIESKIGLPVFPGYKPMPDFIIPDKGFTSNVTIVKKTWEL